MNSTPLCTSEGNIPYIRQTFPGIPNNGYPLSSDSVPLGDSLCVIRAMKWVPSTSQVVSCGRGRERGRRRGQGLERGRGS